MRVRVRVRIRVRVRVRVGARQIYEVNKTGMKIQKTTT